MSSTKMTSKVVVLDRKKSELITLDASQIYHMPQADACNDRARHPILCERFHPAHPSGCMKGDACNRVHAVVRGCPRKPIHINWAWRQVDECQYERFPAGDIVKVREPVSAKSDIVDAVDSGYIIKTRCVFDDVNRPPTHCAHFYYGRECHLGANCDFAHVLYINAQAEKLERAPPPCAFGRRRQTDNNNNCNMNANANATNATTPTVSVRVGGQPFPSACCTGAGDFPNSNNNCAGSPVTPQSQYLESSGVLELHRMRRNTGGSHQSLSLTPLPTAPCTPIPNFLSPIPTPGCAFLPAADESTLSNTIAQQQQQHQQPAPSFTLANNNAPPCLMSQQRWRHDPYNTQTGRSISPASSQEGGEPVTLGGGDYCSFVAGGGSAEDEDDDVAPTSMTSDKPLMSADAMPTFPSALCGYLMTGVTTA